LKKIEEKEMQRKIEFIHQIPLFSKWSVNQVIKLLYSIRVEKFSKGHKLLSQNEPIEKVYIIKEGIVEIS